jgi:lipid II:glycine glycyltransferase (peptidoglycan interpeptide bridge formation enzyme)
MTLACTEITDRQRWNDTLRRLPEPHALQCWEWGKVKRAHRWQPVRLLWTRAGQPVAAAQVLRRSIPRTTWGVMYVPKGPVLDYGDQALVRAVLAELQTHARRHRAILLKIDPDTNRPHVEEILRARGWRYAQEQIQFRNTALLDLSPPEEELLMAMKSKTRYNIRLSGRRGVEVHGASTSDIPLFYEMYAETGERDGFLIRPLSYYDEAWRTFLDAGLGHMLIADVDGEPIAGMILFSFGEKAWFMYGASTNRHRSSMPNYALQWEAIRWAKGRGCATYDMWGAPDTLDESDPLWGVWRFKEGLGAVYTPHIGAYDYPARPLLYWAFETVLPRYVALLHRRHNRDRT